MLATDSYCWSGEGWGSKAGFDLARTALGPNVEDKEIDVLELSPEAVGLFDLVLFLGVLYHMRHPLLALERVAGVTREQLILDTQVDLLWRRRPAVALYPEAELADDSTNWWGPNPSAVDAMLREVGFETIEVVAQFPSFPARVMSATKHAAQTRSIPSGPLASKNSCPRVALIGGSHFVAPPPPIPGSLILCWPANHRRPSDGWDPVAQASESLRYRSLHGPGAA